MHQHHHCGCKHNLKHCEHCDVVYCTKCHKEWSSNWCTLSTTTYPYTYVGSATDTVQYTQTTCKHK